MESNVEITVLNKDFDPIGFIESYESFIWTDRYSEAGDFELYLPVDLAVLSLIKQDYYLSCNLSEHVMVIEQIKIETDVENGNHLAISGRSLESILDRRIVWGLYTYEENSVNYIMKNLLTKNVISPVVDSRRIDNFVFEESTDERITDISINAQFYGDNLFDAIYAICSAYDIGFKIVLTDDKKLVFSLYKGIDRSYNQSINPYVVFSPDFDNLINSNYLESRKNMKNAILIVGEGEGYCRTSTTINLDSSMGLDRREMFEDAGDISMSVDEDTTLSTDEYKALLVERGLEKLAEHTDITAFDGEVESTQMFKYGEDYFMGDIVQVANEYGHEGASTITEVVITQDENGLYVYPTFKMREEEYDEQGN